MRGAALSRLEHPPNTLSATHIYMHEHDRGDGHMFCPSPLGETVIPTLVRISCTKVGPNTGFWTHERKQLKDVTLR